MTRRLLRLLIGLPLYGAGCALTVAAGLGVDPWTVLAQGLAIHTGIGVGWMTNLIGFLVLLLWIPLRQRPGPGTLANILVVGTSMQAVLAIMPSPTALGMRLLALLGGILLVAVASGIYLGANLGAGPRDGLMTGIRDRWGLPVWAARGGMELSVLGAGWLLGGDVGVGTIAFALLIGPLVHAMLPLLGRRRRPRVPRSGRGASRVRRGAGAAPR